MVYHILNGDSLAYTFPETGIEGESVVVRECLIDGDLSGDTLESFWNSRARYLEGVVPMYCQTVVAEFEKILNAPDDSEFNLWFEYDLFCQVNMWFVISIIDGMSIRKKVFVVHTAHCDKTSKHFWNGFGPANSDDLRYCYGERMLLNEADLRFGHELWKAYKEGNLQQLTKLSKIESPVYPYLEEVVKAHVDRFPGDGVRGRPERVIEEILQSGPKEFGEVFKAFWERESIYGFGDVQLRRLFDKVMLDH